MPTYSEPCTPATTSRVGPSPAPRAVPTGTRISPCGVGALSWLVCFSLGIGLLSCAVGVEGVAQPVADEVDREQCQGDRERREENEVRGGADVLVAFGEQSPPARGGRLRTEAKEGEKRFGEDRLRDAEGC